jgi:hypothetical protein
MKVDVFPNDTVPPMNCMSAVSPVEDEKGGNSIIDGVTLTSCQPGGYSARDEHPDYPRCDWVYEVRNGDTGLGYRDWVLHRLEGSEDEASCGTCGTEIRDAAEGLIEDALRQWRGSRLPDHEP